MHCYLVVTGLNLASQGIDKRVISPTQFSKWAGPQSLSNWGPVKEMGTLERYRAKAIMFLATVGALLHRRYKGPLL
jgi:hypothetical protein